MGVVSGGFSLPTAQRTSQLINDTRFSSIREYVLNSSSLKGSSQIDISDIGVNSVIYRIDLIVLSAFSDSTGAQHSIRVYTDDSTLMAAECNDPNEVGTYATDCYATIKSNGSIHISHTLSNMLTGSAILRFYIYNNIDEYARLLTSDMLYYHTIDRQGADVIDN